MVISRNSSSEWSGSKPDRVYARSLKPFFRPIQRSFRRILSEESGDPLQFAAGEPEIRRANNAIHLLRRAQPDNRAGDFGTAQRPRQSHFARRAAMPVADFTHQFDQIQIAREQRFFE